MPSHPNTTNRAIKAKNKLHLNKKPNKMTYHLQPLGKGASSRTGCGNGMNGAGLMVKT